MTEQQQASTLATATLVPRILEDSPVVVRKDWLPTDTDFDELNTLAHEHRETLEDLKDIGSAIIAQQRKYEQEDDRALEAARTAYANGEDPKPPKRTPQSQRENKLAELRDQGTVAQDYLRAVCSTIIQTVSDHLDEWSDVLKTHEQEARDRVTELRAQMEAAQQEADRAPSLRVFLERTAKGRANPGQMVHWGWWLNEQPTQDLLQIANTGVRQYTSAASTAPEPLDGGGVDTDTNATPDYRDEVHDYTSPEYQAELERNLLKNVAQRRASEAGEGTL